MHRLFKVLFSTNEKYLYLCRMTTSAILIGVIYILSLTTTVVPLAVGLEPKGESTPSRRLLVSLVFGATQALMALLGYLLGKMVGYLFGDFLTCYRGGRAFRGAARPQGGGSLWTWPDLT